MSTPTPQDIAIYPCRDERTGQWFCEVTRRDTGAVWFRSDFRKTRGAALRRAKVQLAEKAKLAEAGR